MTPEQEKKWQEEFEKEFFAIPYAMKIDLLKNNKGEYEQGAVQSKWLWYQCARKTSQVEIDKLKHIRYCPECGNEDFREPEEKGRYQCNNRSCLQEWFSDVDYLSETHKLTLQSKTKKLKSLEQENERLKSQQKEYHLDMYKTAGFQSDLHRQLKERDELIREAIRMFELRDPSDDDNFYEWIEKTKKLVGEK